jgi:glycosyltransferase involved in cell wall biosynthesis
MKKLTIGVLSDEFIRWQGGVDFLRLILNGLVNIEENYRVQIIVLVPKKSISKLVIKKPLMAIISYLNLNKKSQNSFDGSKELKRVVESISPGIQITSYRNLEKSIVRKKIDMIMPSFNPLYNINIPWVGYIYDFQHKYLPEYFTETEIEKRDYEFKLMLQNANKIIVNANSVKNDVIKYFPSFSGQIYVLPFSPLIENQSTCEKISYSEKYNLPKDYFLISNQFWRHKNHKTAIKAFSIFLKEIDNNDVCLVCTGRNLDTRFPNYMNEIHELIDELGLTNNVRLLGHINKNYQIGILKRCIALIQPTLFEGGPGGFSVYEAVALGIPSIISDIPVNLEINEKSVDFFSSESPEDLAQKMKDHYMRDNLKLTDADLLKRSKDRLNNLSNKILEIL